MLRMLVATFQLEPDAVALAETLETVPGIEVEAERVAAHSTTWTMPCIWVSCPDFGAVDDALADDPSVESVVDATAFEDQKYYQVDWSDEVDARIDTYLDSEASLLNAQATAEGWELRFRFVTREQFDDFRDVLNDWGYSFELSTLIRPDEPRHSVGELTPDQRDALRAAKRHGYYEVPRGISARELADELDTSHQNLSEVLRRGTAKLIDETLETSADPDG